MNPISPETSAQTPQVRTRAKYILDIEKLTQLPPEERDRLKEVARRYAFRISDYYAELIDWSNPDDALRRLVIPNPNELHDWGKLDASNEQSVTVAKGVQHKYGSTALLLVNEVCGSYCRYCFRKRLFMNENDEVTYDIEPGLEYIRTHKEINNVLLTGGDPLILQTPKLEYVLKSLRMIDHVKIIRIGSKIPAFNPFRILNDEPLLDLFRKYSLPDRRIYLVCHYDHARELTPESREAIRRVLAAGAICVNQNPIIRGISDDADVMATLWNNLSEMGVPQYYVFQGRPTAGNEPFEVPIVEAYFKIEQAKLRCSGLAKRLKYVMSHESGKVEILGIDDSRIYLKYHRAKSPEDKQRFLICHRDDNAFWLDHLKPIDGFKNPYYSGPRR